MDRPSWVPADVDIDTPSVARVYDYFLGGSHNFAADRAFAERMLLAAPDTTAVVRENRAFLGRAVRYIAAQGVDQFVDIGSGIPTVGNVHDVAATVVPDPRVVYVDNDPVAVAHSRAILEGDGNCVVVGADMLDVPVLRRPEVRDHLDLDRPVGVLLAAVLHFVTDDDTAGRLVAELAEDLAPGSYVAISHATAEASAAGVAEEVQDMYTRSVANLALRSHAQVTRLFDGLSLVEPGVVPLPRWRPDPGTEVSDEPYPGYGGIGRVGQPA